MKLRNIFLILLGIYIHASNAQELKKMLPKKLYRQLKDFRYIDSGSVLLGYNHYIKATETDTTLLINNYEHRVNSSSFYICDHEVTNAEYREFINWVRDSIALTLIAEHKPEYYINKEKKILDWRKRKDIWSTENRDFWISLFVVSYHDYLEFDSRKAIFKYHEKAEALINIFPDTFRWIRDFSFLINDPLVRIYFWHPKYNDYPVIGVSWEQANAYCLWKTQRINETNNKELKIRFKLPSEAEWVQSAVGYFADEDADNWRIFPWKGFKTFGRDGKYLANYGEEYDQNSFNTKVFDEDFHNYYIGPYTSRVKSFAPNTINLYDMGGNVAEWTSDSIEMDLFLPTERTSCWSDQPLLSKRINQLSDSAKQKIRDLYIVKSTDDIHTAIKKVIQLEHFYSGRDYRVDTTESYTMKYYRDLAAAELHDAKVLAKYNNLRVVKGGSWATGPAYMLISGREVFPQNSSSSRVGFRLVMDVVKK